MSDPYELWLQQEPRYEDEDPELPDHLMEHWLETWDGTLDER